MRKFLVKLASAGRLQRTGGWLIGAMTASALLGVLQETAAQTLTLQIARDGQGLRLVAPAGVTNLILESSSNLLWGGWTQVPQFPNASNRLVWTDVAARSRFFRLRADGQDPPTPPGTNSIGPPGMVFIPAGSFQMGDPFNEGWYDEVPVHSVFVSGFYMDIFAVRKDLWDSVYAWGLAHGYTFDNPGLGKAANHPVQAVNWYDAVKWCNARSEKEGLTPAYYTTAAQSAVYRAGRVDLGAGFVNWAADGYRLPTEAEWEKAARGGLSGQRFPWGNIITESRANYYSTGLEPYDLASMRGCNRAYLIGLEPYTSPVGSFAPNGYGLYDMAGNVFQWCWDYAQDNWYHQASALQPDTRGPVTGHDRAFRGGAWDYESDRQRCSRRSRDGPIAAQDWEGLGFRCVRGLYAPDNP